MGERWVGAAGQPTTLNGERANAANCDVLSEAVLAATSPEMFETSEAASFSRLSAATRFCRYGGDCYAFGLLASGHIHLVVEAGLEPYDYAALISVVTGATGIITDWYGNPISLTPMAESSPHVQQSSMRRPSPYSPSRARQIGSDFRRRIAAFNHGGTSLACRRLVVQHVSRRRSLTPPTLTMSMG